jgi:hypothetical protein
MAAADDLPRVSWTLPEYIDLMRRETSQHFADQKATNAQAFQEIKSALNGKADKTDVERLEHTLGAQGVRIDKVERRAEILEAERQSRRKHREGWKWAIPSIGTLVAGVAAVLLIFVH